MTRVQEHHSEISPQKFGSDEMDKICVNVGGQKHETYLSTVGHLPDTRLYWIIESVVKSPDYDPETSEVFFDRHPGVFAHILNYYRTGKLHCPTDVCGPLFEQELNYWGIDEKDMEPCCWANYTQHRDAEENLKNVLYEATSEDQIVDSSPVGQPSEVMRIWRKIQPPVWAILDESRSSKQAKIFSFTSVLFIIVSVAMFCINTLPELKSNKKWRSCFTIIETICGIFFTMEFILRAVFCPNKRAFAFNWTTCVDLLAVIPFYLKLVVKDAGNALNVLLVIRLLRLLRFFRLIYGLQVLSHTLKASSYELILLLFMLFIPVIIFSSIVFFIEDNLNHGNTKFRSIPHSFWWSLITITTVGYGDMHPVSWPGKIVGCMCAICGVLIVALPVSIIGGNFTLFYTHAQARLKLPKKKNKIFLPQTSSAIYSEKHLKRTRAIRRRVSSRPSESNSVPCDIRRMSSIHGNSTSCNGYLKRALSRHSSLNNDETRLYSSVNNDKMMPRKKHSTMAIKVPMNDQIETRIEPRGIEEQNEKREVFTAVRNSLSPPEWGNSKFDNNEPYVTRRNMYTDSTSESTKPNAYKADVFAGICEKCLSNNEEENVDSRGGAPETIPLLSSTVNPVKPSEDEDNISQLALNIPIADEQNQFIFQSYSRDKRGSQDSVKSNGGNIRASAIDSERAGTSKRTPRLSFPSISEATTSTDELDHNRTPNTIQEPMNGDISNDEESVCLDVSVEEIHFNRRRRDPVF